MPRDPRDPAWRRYLRFWRRDPRADIDEELRFHLEERVEELIARGTSTGEARRIALTEFGDVEEVRERLDEIDSRIARSRHRAQWWDALWMDLRYAARALARSPGLTATVVVTLALGVGANAAMFSFLDRVFLRPPSGVANPQQIRRFYVTQNSIVMNGRGIGKIVTRTLLSPPELRAIRQAVGRDVRLSSYLEDRSRLGRGDGAQRVPVAYADSGYFEVAGVRPFAGRFFAGDEERLDGAPLVAVVTHRFWRTRLGGSSDVLGGRLELDGRIFTIVGVAPDDFTGMGVGAVDVWLPLGAARLPAIGGRPWYRSRTNMVLQVLGRVASGASLPAIESGATLAIRRPDDGGALRDTAAVVTTGPVIAALGPAQLAQEVSISTRLAAVALLVLLIACANVANLLLVRGVRRRREIALRLALGISRSRLTVMLLAEGLLLATIAAVAALVVASRAGAVLRQLLLPGIEWTGGVLDWRVVGFTLLAAVVTAVLASIGPAFQARRADVTSAIKAGAREGVYQRSRLRSTLVVAQAALSVVLLVAAGLFVRSLLNVRALDLGFDAERLVVASVQLEDAPGDGVLAQRMHAIEQRLAAIPGAEAVGRATMSPMTGFSFMSMYLPGRDSFPKLESGPAVYTGVAGDFFGASGIAIRRGRALNAEDRAGTRKVLVVNETLARTVWPGADALGQCVIFGERTSPCFTVVGVAEDARRNAVIEQPTMQMYVPAEQLPFSQEATSILVRTTSSDGAVVAERVRRALREQFPSAELDVARLADSLAPQFRPWRLGALLFTAFGVLALVVAAIGVYSTVAYAASQRTHEFGVRVALGAEVGDVIRLVLGEGLRTVVVGVVVGGAIALAGGQVVDALLFGVSAHDPLVLFGAGVLIALTALLACLTPAWRASRVDPATALRIE